MWKAGGTKIKRTWARYIVLACVHGNSRKVIFWVKRSLPEYFQQENFSGLLPTESLRTQDSENVVCLGGLRFEVTAAQSEVIGQKPESYKKSEA